jgi:hypothetical protein
MRNQKNFSFELIDFGIANRREMRGQEEQTRLWLFACFQLMFDLIFTSFFDV